MIIPDSKRESCVKATIEWMHQAWLLLQEKRELQPDPFYERNELLTIEVVTNVLKSIEDMFLNEFNKYPGYHTHAQGVSASTILVPPRFLKLPYPQQLAIVQGIDRIFVAHKEA